ncbi:MAG: (d)CMP kinase [Candidatus Omnitrophica bacterium]|nr:(d)CMP kinase [Candidatus Omnitrophota bacterium]
MPSKTLKLRRRTQARRHAGTQAPLVVTIDGPAGAGKSTVAKLLAKALGVAYLDTGATYRALAFAVLQEHPEVLADEARLALMARYLPLRLETGRASSLRVFLNGVEITRAIRSQEISEAAAQVSQYPAVRAAMVAHQRALAGGRGVVVEGRDTGSVVFPDAPYKFFLDADLAVRAQRRQRELLELYREPTPLAQIRQELHFRDLVDQSRPVGRLIKPRGALVIDTTHLTAQHVVRRMLQRIGRARLS